MKITRTPGAMRALSARWRREGRTIGFVPTMGALHAGHLSLLGRARRENRRVAATIFVNPLQFGPREDFARYPRPIMEDAALCRAAGADVLYLPSAAAMYPRGFRTRVEVEGLSDVLCGEFRPGHFRGVATVVLKLLAAAAPDRAYFGEKDYQQLAVIRRMAADLDLPVRVVGCPTVREPDGLAMSSRNAYLSPEERARAPGLRAALESGRLLKPSWRAGPRALERRVRRETERRTRGSADYVRIVDADSLEPAGSLRGRLRLLAALRLGATRLIDNTPL